MDGGVTGGVLLGGLTMGLTGDILTRVSGRFDECIHSVCL